jgi:hypothetical protein
MPCPVKGAPMSETLNDNANALVLRALKEAATALQQNSDVISSRAIGWCEAAQVILGEEPAPMGPEPEVD